MMAASFMLELRVQVSVLRGVYIVHVVSSYFIEKLILIQKEYIREPECHLQNTICSIINGDMLSSSLDSFSLYCIIFGILLRCLDKYPYNTFFQIQVALEFIFWPSYVCIIIYSALPM